MGSVKESFDEVSFSHTNISIHVKDNSKYSLHHTGKYEQNHKRSQGYLILLDIIQESNT